LPEGDPLFLDLAGERDIHRGVEAREQEVHKPEHPEHRNVGEREEEEPAFSGLLGQGVAQVDRVANCELYPTLS
jgi:hypothetical protein